MADERNEFPWTEAGWEAALKENDKFASDEMLATYRPDCEEVVAREMGLDIRDPSIDEGMAIIGAGFRAGIERIDAYKICEHVAEEMRRALRPIDKRQDPLVSRLIGEAWIGIHTACAKIAGGHGLGYDDDRRYANIVMNKRALEGAQRSVKALGELRNRKALPDQLVDRLVLELRKAGAAIESRIAELRSEVWWS